MGVCLKKKKKKKKKKAFVNSGVLSGKRSVCDLSFSQCITSDRTFEVLSVCLDVFEGLAS